MKNAKLTVHGRTFLETVERLDSSQQFTNDHPFHEAVVAFTKASEAYLGEHWKSEKEKVQVSAQYLNAWVRMRRMWWKYKDKKEVSKNSTKPLQFD